MKLDLYTKDNCGFCVKAKAFLNLHGIGFNEIHIDIDEDAKNFLVEEGHRSVPQIYFNGKLLVAGGFMGLHKLSKDEITQLMEKLNASETEV